MVGAVAAIEDERHHRTIVEPPRGNSSAAVADKLREQHILVRRYDLDPIAGWLRITVGTREQHQRLLAALKEILV